MALAGLGLGIDQVTSAVSAANSIAPMGTLVGPNQSLAIQADTQMTKADEFRQIIVASPDGRPVRLGDIADVIDSVANTQTTSVYDGKESLVLAVFRQPDANTVDVVDRVKAHAAPICRRSRLVGEPERVQRPRDLDYAGRKRRRADPRIDRRPGGPRHLSFPAADFGNAHSDAGSSDFPDRDIRRHVCAWPLDRQRFAARSDTGGRAGRRRRDRHAREHRAPHRGGDEAVRGGPQRESRGRVHDRIDHPVAGGRIPARAADGGCRRQNLQRVRARGDDRHHCVSGRFVDGDADVVRKAAVA